MVQAAGRRRFARGIVGCLVGVSSVCVCPRLHAEPLDLELTWNVPAGCPDAREVLDAIERLTGGAGSGDAPELSVQANIEERGSTLALRLIWSTASMQAERRMESSSCQELARAVALVVALAADPNALRASPEAATPAVAGGGPAPADQPAQIPRASATAPPRVESSAPTHAPRLAGPDAGLLRRRRPGARERLEVMARAQLVFDAGSLPRPAEGAALGVSVPFGAVVAQAELSAFIPQRKAIAEGAADLWLGVIALRPCLDLFDAQLHLLPCVAAELDVLVGHGQDVDFRQGGAAWFPRFGAGVEIAYAFSQRLALIAEGWLLAAPLRPTFVLNEVIPVHQPGVVVGRWSTGLELRL